jgi:NAD(P)-dependent dehydrogenase (short-subunit alcohol dehydrogenase family)
MGGVANGMQIDLHGKRVLVTGGNSGLGSAIVRAIGKTGARVAINYVAAPADAEALAAELKHAGGEAIAIDADISAPEAVAKMFATLDRTWGGIDVLINNAGIDGARAMAWDAEVDAWRKVIDINLVGAFLCAREALKRMTSQKSGVIINTTSVHEVIAWSGHSAYAASKAGLSMMAKTLAQEAGPYGVRVLAIAPGAIATPINEDVWRNPAGLKDLLTKVPMGRIGKPEDIAGMAVVLASDVASYVTATTVFVDGGMTDYPDFMHGG